MSPSRSPFTLRSLRTALTLVLLVSIGLWLLPTTPAHAEVPQTTPRQNLWTTDGPVYAIQQVGNTIYLGGGFTSVGPDTGNGLPLSVSDGTPPPAFLHVQGIVNAVVADGAGG